MAYFLLVAPRLQKERMARGGGAAARGGGGRGRGGGRGGGGGRMNNKREAGRRLSAPAPGEYDWMDDEVRFINLFIFYSKKD